MLQRPWPAGFVGEMEEEQCAVAEHLYTLYPGWRDLSLPQMLADESVRSIFAASIADIAWTCALDGDARSRLARGGQIRTGRRPQLYS